MSTAVIAFSHFKVGLIYHRNPPRKIADSNFCVYIYSFPGYWAVTGCFLVWENVRHFRGFKRPLFAPSHKFKPLSSSSFIVIAFAKRHNSIATLSAQSGVVAAQQSQTNDGTRRNWGAVQLDSQFVFFFLIQTRQLENYDDFWMGSKIGWMNETEWKSNRKLRDRLIPNDFPAARDIIWTLFWAA